MNAMSELYDPTALHEYMRESCPGPHKFEWHQDALPEHCTACGRTTRGVRVVSESEDEE